MTPPATEAPFARRDSTLRFLALDRPYGGVVDWCVVIPSIVYV